MAESEGRQRSTKVLELEIAPSSRLQRKRFIKRATHYPIGEHFAKQSYLQVSKFKSRQVTVKAFSRTNQLF